MQINLFDIGDLMAGHVNHSIFWKNLAPISVSSNAEIFFFVIVKLNVTDDINVLLQEGGGEPPKSSLGWAIDSNFGSLEALIQKMNAEGAAVQGSGWVVSFTDSFL